MAKGKGSTSSNKKKATPRGRAAEKAAGTGGRTSASVKKMSQSRYPGERPLTGEDRPANTKGGKVSGGPSRTPRGRGRIKEVEGKGATDKTPDTGMASPSPMGRHMT